MLLVSFSAQGQPILNERYIINDATSSVFSSVIATDSCYYVTGGHTSGGGFTGLKAHFVKFNLEGTVVKSTEYSNDTMGIGFMGTTKMINTLDGNFAQIAIAKESDFPTTYMFMKLNAEGDTILTKYYTQFYLEDFNNGKDPSTLIQNSDSSYFGLIQMQNDTNYLVGVTFFKLDKNGTLLFRKNFYGAHITTYNALASASMVRYDENKIIIGAAYRRDYEEPEDKRNHTKLLILDTLGNLIDERLYTEDTLALDCYGLTKTVDGGLLYAGRYGRYNVEYDVIGYKAQIAKLDADFNREWSIQVGSGYTGSPYIGLRNILALNDSEFVAVGFMKQFSPKDRNQYGWLIKFNIDGEKIWERKYLKIPHEHLAPNYPEHQLFDVDTTVDGGFVMVGAGINYENEDELSGQKAWLIKTNRYGCIVPGCQFGDIPMDAEPKDTAIVQKPPKPEEPQTWLYPNPTSNSLFYYHHQDVFNFGTAYIYNSAGELVQKWDISVNDITYEIDVSGFASGQYVLQVLNGDGKLIEVERFVKI